MDWLDIKMNKTIYIIFVILCIVNIQNVYSYGDADGDGVIDEGDDCPYQPAEPYVTSNGCPNYIIKEPEYQGPEWILTIIQWHAEKRIDDKTFQNAIEYLLEKKIITIK